MGLYKYMKIIVIISILLLLGLLIYNKHKPHILFALVGIFYFLIGYIDYKEYFIGFTNSALITLVLLMVASIAIEKTSFIDYCSKKIFSKSYKLSILKLGLISCFFSAFLNNTAVVASLMGVIKQNKFHSASKLLMPLSFFALAGGTLTLIGTSTNMVVNSFVIENKLESLKMFDFFIVGLGICIAIIVVIMFFSFLLPDYKNDFDEIKDYIINTKVVSGSSLINKSVKENKLKQLQYLFLVEIKRKNRIISPVSNDEIILEDDELIFSGDIQYISILSNFNGLKLCENVELNKLNLVEVVISNQSSLIGKSVKEVSFRAKFDAAIICYKRANESIKKIGECVICAGDSLILSVGSDFASRDNKGKNFHIISKMYNPKFNTKQSFIILSSFVSVILLNVFNCIDIVKGLLLLLMFYIGAKYINIDEIRRRIPLDIIIIIGSSLAITRVLISSGVAADFANLIVNTFGVFGNYGALVGVYLMTLLLTELITNNAAAALSFPIAYSSALSLGLSPYPFIFIVAYAASASFMTPFGYQTNLMVSSAGNYKFMDFVKIGWIASIAYSLVVLIVTPMVFKF